MTFSEVIIIVAFTFYNKSQTSIIYLEIWDIICDFGDANIDIFSPKRELFVQLWVVSFWDWVNEVFEFVLGQNLLWRCPFLTQGI